MHSVLKQAYAAHTSLFFFYLSIQCYKPSANLWVHSWHALAKNSLLKAVQLSLKKKITSECHTKLEVVFFFHLMGSLYFVCYIFKPTRKTVRKVHFSSVGYTNTTRTVSRLAMRYPWHKNLRLTSFHHLFQCIYHIQGAIVKVCTGNLVEVNQMYVCQSMSKI